MRKFTVLIFLFLLSNYSFAQDRELFRGGMFLHTGYQSNNMNFPKIDGLIFGIGGKISFRFGDNFRFGTEGYVSTYKYDMNEGNYKIGWGGLLAEYQFSNKKLNPVAGLTLGGGKVHDLFMLSGKFDDDIVDAAIYKVYTVLIASPHISLEYTVSESINLVLKTDYQFYINNNFPDYIAKGPRFYIGILFMR